jgi:hypothetical protein
LATEPPAPQQQADADDVETEPDQAPAIDPAAATAAIVVAAEIIGEALSAPAGADDDGRDEPGHEDSDGASENDAGNASDA